MIPRPHAFIQTAASALAALLIVAGFACSGGSDGESGGDSPDVPDGWNSFSEGAWSGYVPSSWNVIKVDSSDVLSQSDLEDIPGITQQTLDSMFASGGLSEVVFVFIDENPTFATNINMLGCFSNAESAPKGREVEAYRNAGVQASVVEEVEFNGENWNLIKAPLIQSNDTYQILTRDGSCNMVITLSTRPQDRSPIEDLFLGLLEVDVDALDK
jgi:hypothetical protein